MNSNQNLLGGGTHLRDKNVIVKLLLWCSLSIFIGLSAISQGGVTRFIPGILVSTTILFYLIVIRANSVTYSSLKQFKTKIGVFSIASAAGTLCCVADTIYHMIMKSGAISKLMSKGISNATIQVVVVIALIAMSFVAIYGVSVIFNYVLSNIVALIDIIIDKKHEINNIVAIVVCVLYFLLIVWVYRNTTAFYGSGYNDVIYGSDSYTLTSSNVWLSLFQGQNDLRQPLYMLTAAPFMGIAYILGIILNCFSVNGLAIAYAFVQALLLVWSIWLLSRLISDNDIIRSLIILMLSVSYPAIVFSLCLEQYVSSFFWLIMAVAAVMYDQKKADLMIIGASNGLLTSAFMIVWKKAKSFIEWFQSAFKCGMLFLLALFAFGRADIFLNIKANLAEIFQYTGKKLTIVDKAYQYSKFVADCFVGQPATEKVHNSEFLIWGSSESNTINVVGIIIIVLIIIAVIWNRNTLLCKISASWIGFSVLLLCVLGWGTSSNALFLYALYFSWAFWTPLFLSFQKIYNKGYKKSVIVILTCLFILMAKCNVAEFIRMLNFAVENYPL
ncbi:hypothetical protein [uncultured Holdemanella sp.]|uniref:hypothetical protein n=1 Tax=uncultured Holdemanella sp. TaxID=1763549 RepID=UPI000E53A173|nr:hypothetical protein [uncultured Holdemanella sp.]RGH50067.1 hypothetical protein DW894_03190 [Ruminococcus sp. AM41-10BH]